MVYKNGVIYYLTMRTPMKRAVVYFLVLLGFSTLLIQCATQQDVEYTNVKVRQMDTKVEDINKEIDALKEQTVQSVQARQAETGDRLDYQQSELLRLQGKIDESNFLIRQLQEENRQLKKELQSRIEGSDQKNTAEIKRLNERMTLSEEQLLKTVERVNFTENEIRAIREARSQEAAQRAMEAAERAREAEKKARMAAAEPAPPATPLREITPGTYKVNVSSQNITEPSGDEKEAEKAEPQAKVKTASLPPTPPPAPAAAPPSAPPATPPAPAVAGSLEEGMTLFKQKKYREAYNSFADYLDKNPSGSQAVEARYYAAESLYEVKDYELAILEFQKVIVEHPKHELAPSALYKQGLAFEKIGDPETARIVYNKLVDTYPKSEMVASAKSRLESLKK